MRKPSFSPASQGAAASLAPRSRAAAAGLLVVYLVWSKRLFGVRGGKQAYEARLRTESVMEVEQAALVAAAPAAKVPPGRARG